MHARWPQGIRSEREHGSQSLRNRQLGIEVFNLGMELVGARTLGRALHRRTQLLLDGITTQTWTPGNLALARPRACGDITALHSAAVLDGQQNVLDSLHSRLTLAHL